MCKVSSNMKKSSKITLSLLFIVQISLFCPLVWGQSQDGDSDNENEVTEFRITRNNTESLISGDLIAALDNENKNEVIESYSPPDFIFNSCELEKYRAPKLILERFPYYHAGFDEMDRPIWIGEFGKYDLRSVTAGGKELEDAFDAFTKDVSYNMVKSIFKKPGKGRPTFQFVFIIDFEGFGIDQITLGNLRYMIKLARQYTRLIDEYCHSVVVINVNYVAEMLTNAVRPVFGRIFEKVTLFGTNKDKWLPYMRRNFPLDALPEWYGGKKNFKPLQVFGR